MNFVQILSFKFPYSLELAKKFMWWVGGTKPQALRNSCELLRQ